MRYFNANFADEWAEAYGRNSREYMERLRQTMRNLEQARRYRG